MSDLQELSRMKREINLTEYAASVGYALDRKESSSNFVVMRHNNDDKIIITKGYTGQWIYFSVRNDKDKGTIIDFVQKRQSVNLGMIRRILRPWLSGGTKTIPETNYTKILAPSNKDQQAVICEYNKTQCITKHSNFLHKRGVPLQTITSNRFDGKIRIDKRQSIIFPHKNTNGLCGFDIKNFGFTGFSKGGEKGLWFSAANKSDTRLVLTESAIDALSFYTLNPDRGTRYASISGRMNRTQPDLIKKAIQRMPQGAEIIIAMDNDLSGHELAEQIETLAEQTKRADLIISKDFPQIEGQDWNNVLTNKTD